MAKFNNPTKVITGVNTRWSYANVWHPKAINGGAPKYSVSLIIPKSDTATVNKIKAAIQAAYDDGEAKLKGNGKSVPPLSALKTPMRDGDLEHTKTHILLTQIQQPHRELLMPTDSRSLTHLRYTVVFTAERLSIFTHSTLTEIKELPADLTIFRR